MGVMMRKAAGILLLIATIGVASCQAFLGDASGVVTLPIELQD